MHIQSHLTLLLVTLLLAISPPVFLHAGTLTTAEAFLDDPTVAPGYGIPLTLDINSPNALRNAIGTIDMTGIESGAHTLYLRFLDGTGDWSAPIGQTIYVTPGAPAQPFSGGKNRIMGAELFIDDDPGQGLGTPLVATDGSINSTIEVLRGIPNLNGLSIGVHVLHIRFLDRTGIWSLTQKSSFYLPTAITQKNSSFWLLFLPNIINNAKKQLE